MAWGMAFAMQGVWGRGEGPIVTGACKVEAFFARCSGKRGAVVVSLEDRAAVVEAVAKGDCLVVFGKRVYKCQVRQAYSARSSSNSWHCIRTWHK